MIRSDSLDQFAAALSAFQSEVATIPKTAANPFFKSKYADLPTVVEVASPILTKHGLSVAQFISHDPGGGDTLITWVLHSSGQYIADSMAMRPIKDDPQAQGSAVTYARRYAYMSALGLVADVDDDANAATQAGNRRTTGRRETRSKPAQSRSKGNGQAAPSEAPSGAENGSGGPSPVTTETLEALSAAYKAAGSPKDALKAMIAEAGAEGKKPQELSEDQATWVVLKLREAK